MDDEIKAIKDEIDLREYYDIKRPTVVFFKYSGDEKKKGKKNRMMSVMRYDILSETCTETPI